LPPIATFKSTAKRGSAFLTASQKKKLVLNKDGSANYEITQFESGPSPDTKADQTFKMGHRRSPTEFGKMESNTNLEAKSSQKSINSSQREPSKPSI